MINVRQGFELSLRIKKSVSWQRLIVEKFYDGWCEPLLIGKFEG